MRALAAIALAFAAVAATGEDAAARGMKCRPYDAKRDGPLASWARPRQVTLLVDSVLLSAYPAIKKVMPCWHVAKRGRPAWMIRAAESELRAAGKRVSPTVVVGIGYNSLWERNRRNYGRWSSRFDAEALKLIATLKRLGAKQIVWVTLREPRPSTVPPRSVGELRQYSWYFPYVNARLKRIARGRRDVVLAHWAKASDRRGLTYDTIHTNSAGGLLMGRTIKRAILAEARHQAGG